MMKLPSNINRMDRIDFLLQTLLEQRASNAKADSLLSTLSLLQFELQKEQYRPVQEWGTSKVSVLLPSPPATPPTNSPASSPADAKPSLPLKEDKPVAPILKPAAKTLGTEINAAIIPDASLNDRLKDQTPILAETMQDSPIKDLRKGISLNERYQLVKELFEGDESCFDKTIKTINSFSILAEAQFWMDKELRSKPGWQSESAAAQLLNQLVKRRFS